MKEHLVQDQQRALYAAVGVVVTLGMTKDTFGDDVNRQTMGLLNLLRSAIDDLVGVPTPAVFKPAVGLEEHADALVTSITDSVKSCKVFGFDLMQQDRDTLNRVLGTVTQALQYAPKELI